MKHFRFLFITIFLMGMTMSGYAQCVDMTTMDDGKKVCGHKEGGVVEDSVAPGGQIIHLIGWHEPQKANDYSRVSLMTDADAKDDLCPNISVLPPDETTSIRLKSSAYQEGDTAHGEMVQITLTVDAARPLLLFNYAAVMEAPDHKNIASFNQPYFFFAIFNLENDSVINTLMHYSTNENKTNIGWQSFNDKNRNNVKTIWKDWSKEGLDLSEYAGKEIVVQISNHDCVLSGMDRNGNATICEDHHLSHLYTHITCAPKQLYLNKDCESSDDSVYITAPEGFSYKWYVKGKNDEVLSSDRILQIKAESVDVTYCCQLTSAFSSFTLEQEVDAPEVVVDDPEDVGFGQTFVWSRSGEKIVVTGDYEYAEPYSGKDTLEYSKSCAKTIYRIHVDVAQLDCPGTFTIKDTICGDARGFNVAFHYERKIDNSKEEPDTIYPSVQTVKVDFSDNWNKQQNQQIVVDKNTKLTKSGYEDITQAIKVNGVAMDSVFFVPMPYDSVYRDNGDGTGEWIYAAPRPDNYTMTLIVTNSCGQEERRQVPFTVFYPANVIYQRWNDVLAIHNEKYNGGNNIKSVKWYKDGVQIPSLGDHGSYIYDKQLVTNIATYYAELTREDDNKTFCTCRFTPAQTDAKDELEFKQSLSVAPRRNNPRQLQVTTQLSGTYQLFDISGRLMQSGVYGEQYGEPDIVISQSLAQGTYILHFRTKDNEGTTIAKKIIVQ